MNCNLHLEKSTVVFGTLLLATLFSLDLKAFNNDKKTDIVWRHQVSGQNTVWYMGGSSGATYLSSANVANLPDTNWKIVGTGDFNNNGQLDILWRHATTGQNAAWILEGTNFVTSASIATVSDTSWEIVGTGYFNADGYIDILWRQRTTGANVIWFMNGTTQTGSTYIQGQADLNWKIVGTGDFNNDGKCDILWRNSATGQNAVWYMNGSTYLSTATIQTVADTNWEVAGTGYFNSDSYIDLLWRHRAGGGNVIWFMSGVVQTSSTYIADPGDNNWKIVGTGDAKTDCDGDLICNLVEYGLGGNPTVSNSKVGSLPDGVYFKLAQFGAPTMTSLTGISFQGNSVVVTLAGALVGSPYDIFYTPALGSVGFSEFYSGPADGGQTGSTRTYTIRNPGGPTAYFEAGLGTDTDGDGYNDGYEILVSHTDVGDENSNELSNIPLNLSFGGVFGDSLTINYTSDATYGSDEVSFLDANGTTADSLVVEETAPGQLTFTWDSIFLEQEDFFSIQAQPPTPPQSQKDLIHAAFSRGSNLQEGIISRPNQQLLNSPSITRETLEHYQEVAAKAIRRNYRKIQLLKTGQIQPSAFGLQRDIEIAVNQIHTQTTRFRAINRALSTRFSTSIGRYFPVIGGILIIATGPAYAADFAAAMQEYANDIATGMEEGGDAGIIANLCEQMAPGSRDLVLDWLLLP